MRCLRQFVWTQSGGLLGLYIAYSLAIQAMMASVGLGMSAGAALDQAGFVFCGVVSHQIAPVPGKQAPVPTPQCPFCFVVAYSVGHLATAGEPPAFPSYVGVPIAAVPHPANIAFVPQFRRCHGEPRAPPVFSA